MVEDFENQVGLVIENHFQSHHSVAITTKNLGIKVEKALITIIEKCSKQHVVDVVNHAKFHFAHHLENQYFAMIVLQNSGTTVHHGVIHDHHIMTEPIVVLDLRQ
jgi:hypothetical protein